MKEDRIFISVKVVLFSCVVCLAENNWCAVSLGAVALWSSNLRDGAPRRLSTARLLRVSTTTTNVNIAKANIFPYYYKCVNNIIIAIHELNSY